MPWVRFTQPYDYEVRHGVTIAYRAGRVKLVTRRCADEAVAAGKAERARRPAEDGADGSR